MNAKQYLTLEADIIEMANDGDYESAFATLESFEKEFGTSEELTALCVFVVKMQQSK